MADPVSTGPASAGPGSTSPGPPPSVVLVPHTHWDREWYEPFQRFRMRLVDVVDDVLVRADADPEFRFTFDGQMAAVEDYLEVRPQNRDRVAAAVRRGQFAIGPWRVLLDEFLCSGENIIRNLQIGQRQAAALGGSMGVGYLPDMFGHIAQMPQILRSAGIEYACVYRGVPAEVTGHRFRWVSPDGSAIDTEYLIAGYGNVSDLFDDPDDLPGRLARRLARFAGAFEAGAGTDVGGAGSGGAGSGGTGAGGRDAGGRGTDRPGADAVLAMYGTDHSGPLPTLMPLVRRLGEERGRALTVATLSDYVRAFPPDAPGLPQWYGELRSHARANILPGVISVRPRLKADLAEAERMVQRYAEPLQALWGTDWPEVLLDLAWTKLVDCSCHDSVTGCGVDDTAVQVAARIAEAGHIGQAVRDDVTAALARAVPSDAVLVVNPSPRRREMLVTATLPTPIDGPADGAVDLIDGDGNRYAAQDLGAEETVLADEEVAGADLATLFRRVHDRELFGRQIRRLVIESASTPPELTFFVGADAGPDRWDPTTARDRAAAAGAHREGPWRVRIVDQPRRTVAARIAVPALGTCAARLSPSSVAGGRPVATAPTVAATVTADAAGLVGDGITVAVKPDGSLRITKGETVLDGVGELVDGGDAGDSYNYAPPTSDTLVSEPDSVRVELVHPGPVLASVRILRRYAWPQTSDRERRSAQAATVEVSTLVELRSGEPFVRIDVEFDNVARDHRLRMHIPCSRAAETSHAAGQFAVVERGRHPEGGPVGEQPIPTYPATGFVDAGGVGVLLTGPTEYELLADPDAIALTLMRSVGYLSRNRNAMRDEPAGPQLGTPLAQSPGPHRVRLAIAVHAGDWHEADVVERAEEFLLEPVVRAGSAALGELPAAATGMTVEGTGVALAAVVAGPGGAIDIRMVAMTPHPTVATVTRGARAVSAVRVVDLLGREVEGEESAGMQPVIDGDGTCRVPLRPWQIRTVRVW